MGIKDYEDFVETKVGDSNRIEVFKTNTNYIYHYVKYCLENTPGGAVNRHCFKFARLRDEIFFIKCFLIRPDAQYEMSEYCFVVTEKSFWNRFNIYLKSSPTSPVHPSDGISVSKLVKMITNDRELVERISITLFPYEERKLNDIYSKLPSTEAKDEFLRYNVVNNAVCEICSMEHYNKRIWIELLTQPVKPPGSSVNVSHNFGDYKDPNSLVNYNPKDPDYIDIMYLYL